ncbi:hypothetical protein KEM55_002171 [Ascosphaera atra]|nr:hypothetical protein KEM55_002171 [Ascosphaera atra]
MFSAPPQQVSELEVPSPTEHAVGVTEPDLSTPPSSKRWAGRWSDGSMSPLSPISPNRPQAMAEEKGGQRASNGTVPMIRHQREASCRTIEPSEAERNSGLVLMPMLDTESVEVASLHSPSIRSSRATSPSTFEFPFQAAVPDVNEDSKDDTRAERGRAKSITESLSDSDKEELPAPAKVSTARVVSLKAAPQRPRLVSIPGRSRPQSMSCAPNQEQASLLQMLATPPSSAPPDADPAERLPFSVEQDEDENKPAVFRRPPTPKYAPPPPPFRFATPPIPPMSATRLNQECGSGPSSASLLRARPQRRLFSPIRTDLQVACEAPPSAPLLESRRGLSPDVASIRRISPLRDTPTPDSARSERSASGLRAFFGGGRKKEVKQKELAPHRRSDSVPVISQFPAHMRNRRSVSDKSPFSKHLHSASAASNGNVNPIMEDGRPKAIPTSRPRYRAPAHSYSWQPSPVRSFDSGLSKTVADDTTDDSFLSAASSSYTADSTSPPSSSQHSPASSYSANTTLSSHASSASAFMSMPMPMSAATYPLPSQQQTPYRKLTPAERRNRTKSVAGSLTIPKPLRVLGIGAKDYGPRP